MDACLNFSLGFNTFRLRLMDLAYLCLTSQAYKYFELYMDYFAFRSN
jgi:hypothetical protein